MGEDRILLVDDEEDFVTTLAKRLRRRGLTVETAADGESALELVRRQEFGVIVLDLAMPGLDGIETLRRMKESDPELQVILLTGHGTVGKGVEAMKLGAVDFLQKPATFESLLDKIREATGKRAIIVERRTEEHISEILREQGW